MEDPNSRWVSTSTNKLNPPSTVEQQYNCYTSDKVTSPNRWCGNLSDQRTSTVRLLSMKRHFVKVLVGLSLEYPHHPLQT